MFLGALLFLQAIALLWFYMVIKVALKVLKGNTADDLRSDDEADEEVAHENEKKQLQPYEEEVGVEEINLKGRHGNGKTRYRKPGSHSSGVSHSSDRKELLGRIGCDKPI
jgi:acyl-CoA-dependent ceramide synthase